MKTNDTNDEKKPTVKKVSAASSSFIFPEIAVSANVIAANRNVTKLIVNGTEIKIMASTSVPRTVKEYSNLSLSCTNNKMHVKNIPARKVHVVDQIPHASFPIHLSLFGIQHSQKKGANIELKNFCMSAIIEQNRKVSAQKKCASGCYFLR